MKLYTSRFLTMALVGACVVCNAQIIEPLSAKADSRPTAAAPHREAIELQGIEYVVPELILGGEWTSTIKLTNQGNRSIPTTPVYFYDNFGNPLQATFQTTGGSVVTDVGFSFSLSVGSLLEVTFFGGRDTLFGHGIVGCPANGCGTPGLYGEVTLRNRNSTRPDFESVFPFEKPVPLQYMLFDGRNGFTMALYLSNENSTSSQIVLEVDDSLGRAVRTVTLTLGPLETQIQTLHVLSQETIGIQGTLVLQGRNSNGTALITATGLRINPSNSFTPLRAFVPAPNN